MQHLKVHTTTLRANTNHQSKDVFGDAMKECLLHTPQIADSQSECCYWMNSCYVYLNTLSHNSVNNSSGALHYRYRAQYTVLIHLILISEEPDSNPDWKLATGRCLIQNLIWGWLIGSFQLKYWLEAGYIDWRFHSFPQGQLCNTDHDQFNRLFYHISFNIT